MFYLFGEKRGVMFSMSAPPSEDERMMTRIGASSVYGIDHTGLVLVGEKHEWPEQTKDGLEYLGQHDTEALIALCNEVSAEVKKVFGGSILDRIAAAEDEEGNDLWLSETVGNIRNFCFSKIKDLLRIYALGVNADKAVAHENSYLRGENTDLQVALAMAHERNKALRGELREEEVLNKELIQGYVNTEQRDSPDPMTGADKMKAFIFDLYHSLSRAEEGDSVAVVMLDLDRFKEVNDTSINGHADGDTVLKMFVDAVKDVLGNRGRIYRLGGEEFAVILYASEEEIPGIMQELHDSIYKRVVWRQDPNKTGLIPAVIRKSKELWRQFAGIFDKVFLKRQEEEVQDDKFVSFGNEGIDLGELDRSNEKLGASLPDAKVKKVTVSAGVVVCPSSSPGALPKWRKSAVVKKALAILDSLEGSVEIMANAVIKGKVQEDSRFESYVEKATFDTRILGLMAYMILAGDRASYQVKKTGRNGTRIVDGTGIDPRDGREIARCEEAGDVS